MKGMNKKNRRVYWGVIGLMALLTFMPSALLAEGLLSRILFFQRNSESVAQKEQTTKDLLREAIDQAVFKASQVNGFYHEAEFKIQAPGPIKKMEGIARKFRIKFLEHDVELGMNRAAEKAAPKAGLLMKQALNELEFEQDPEKILKEEGSLTAYFRKKMEERLIADFKREIERSIGEERSLNSYVEIKNLYASLPFVKNTEQVFRLEDDLSRHALEGIFSRVQKEEGRLRHQQPVA